ncbi:MAG: hypothetical protein ACRC1K_16585, partial [Planctomycetia bacterium]
MAVRSTSAGVYTFDVIVSDGATTDVEAFTVTVNEINCPPTLAPIADLRIPSCCHSPSRPPRRTPTEAQGPGTYSFTVRVTVGSLEDFETFTLTVSELDVDADPVVLNVAPRSGSQGQAVALNPVVALMDLDGSETLALTISGVPAGSRFQIGGSAVGTDAGGGVLTFAGDVSGLTFLPSAEVLGDVGRTSRVGFPTPRELLLPATARRHDRFQRDGADGEGNTGAVVRPSGADGPSGPSSYDFWVEGLQFDSGVGGGELPVDSALLPVAVFVPRRRLPPQ